MSDIRGYYDKFIKMLDLIDYNSDDSLILIGNIIDKNLNSIDMINWIINYKYPRIMLLRGSNEEEFLQCIDKVLKSKSIRSLVCDNYDYYTIINTLILNGISLELLYKTFNTSKQYKRKIGSYTYTFANSCVPSLDYKNKKEFCLYSSYEDIIEYGGISIPFYYNIFGHYPTTEYYDKENNKGKIIKLSYNNKNLININCGVYLPNDQGKLSCIRLDDLEEFYV